MTADRDNQEPNTPIDGETTTVRTQAAFVNKLYKMLEDNTIRSLISWSDRGDLFSVSNPTSFSKSVLPQYFKHNNWQSFVRQLNMYGFHKVNDMIHSNLTSDNQTWEFKHPHFKRGEVEELQNIKRKSTKPSFATATSPSRIPLTRLPSDNDDDVYGPLYKHILHIEDRLHHVSKSYEILKNETNSLRTVLNRQQQTISDFAVLLGDVLEGEDCNLGVNTSSKKGIILSKLSDLQSQFVTDNVSQESLSTGTQPNNPNSPVSTRSLEQFLSSQQQQYQYGDTSYSSRRSSDAKQPIPHVNRRMGFGKESHLLNPEPTMKNY
ncbi:hypothetical protein INT47_008868, partial [Mucor saturninus]